MSQLFHEISKLDTEQINPNTVNIDCSDTTTILTLINQEDAKVPLAIREEIPYIAQAVDLISDAFRSSGRLIYFGAGTSGRLGVVDASECPPTFGVAPEMVQGVIAGGRDAMFQAQEGAEDSEQLAEEYFDKLGINSNDIVCGIAASGRTPFVIGALKSAKSRNISTVMITTISRTNAGHLLPISDVLICPYVGAEVIAGSTRMKSGTAQKLVLNMLTTAAMIKIGKTYNNIMVDLQLTNKKLKERAKKIIMQIADVDYDAAVNLLEITNGKVKPALVMALADVELETANNALAKANGIVKRAVKLLQI